ncbi:alpha/beta fold hydrolase [Nocardia aobensis]|uniref:Alpha/beta fold hydrolase n=1 Tax=Nocardia aobensis TaxID=257277 RepID=A0ABW6PEJ7_9NOCA|nr:alpha/beta fold hydrolase [Nocardia elegans]MBF6451078.1 alpha/beta fold hydrolase [Nocardia elegans]
MTVQHRKFAHVTAEHHLGISLKRLIAAVPLVIFTVCAPATSPSPAAAAPDIGIGEVAAVTPLRPAELMEGAGSGYLITYWTTDEYGAPALANGQVYLPPGDAPSGGWPVISWGKGTVGIGDQCAMTSTLAAGQADPPAVDMSRPLLSAALAAGTAVISTDYIGLGTPAAHHYLNGISEAHAVIDILRAARREFPQLSTTFVAAGHSQGGQAALLANQISDTYATGLDFRGTVAFAPASNSENVIAALGPEIPEIPDLTPLTATIVYVLHGLRDARPDLNIGSYLTDYGKQQITQAEQLCIMDLRKALNGIPPQRLLSRALSDAPIAAAIRAYMTVPISGYPHPIFLMQGRDDTTVRPVITAVLNAELRAGGVDDIVSQEYPGADHYDIVAHASTDAMNYIREMLR